ncbi:hypothetical protein FRC02_004664 [Tulasnella sp. 418]|nr:hypothetical protein FRC02_004664 [Tulasnella sp. 418]
MTLLPLHAAGPYKDAEPNLQDLFISSYTSTLSALIKARKSGSDASPLTTFPKTVIPKLLIIAQPRVPNQAEIDGVRKEVQKIQLAVPSTNILMDEGGTYAHVIAGLGAHNWVHFATHGTQNTRNPFHSCFHIHDRDLTLLDIVNARLPNAEFAFLSVCHGAAGDENNPDETIHLAAGLQFCGFRSVIGTRYAMADVDGPIVAEEVYKHMFRKVGKGEEEANSQVSVDYRDAAEALNIATRVLKNSGAPIERWINFIHIGA